MAKEREGAALDQFARQGSQLAGERRKVQTALEKSQAEVEELRGELDSVRADAGAQIAAAVEQASAAQHRAEERLAERAADRRVAQAEVERLRGEIEAIRSDAETEIAAAIEGVKAADDRAHQRAAERVDDPVAAREAIEQLQTYLEQAPTPPLTSITRMNRQHLPLPLRSRAWMTRSRRFAPRKLRPVLMKPWRPAVAPKPMPTVRGAELWLLDRPAPRG